MNATYMDIIVTDNYYELSVKAVRHDTAVTAENDAKTPPLPRQQLLWERTTGVLTVETWYKLSLLSGTSS